jgi:hypothetical protein
MGEWSKCGGGEQGSEEDEGTKKGKKKGKKGETAR